MLYVYLIRFNVFADCQKFKIHRHSVVHNDEPHIPVAIKAITPGFKSNNSFSVYQRNVVNCCVTKANAVLGRALIVFELEPSHT